MILNNVSGVDVRWGCKDDAFVLESFITIWRMNGENFVFDEKRARRSQLNL